MPDRSFAIGGMDGDAKQPGAQIEETIEHLGKREPRSQRFLIEIELFLAEFLSPVGHIPGLEVVGFRCVVASGAVAECVNLPLGCRLGGSPELFQQGFHGIDVIGHLAGQAQLGPMAVAQSARLFAPQAQDGFDQWAVVEITLAGSADMGAIDRLPQPPVLGMGEERDVARHVEPDPPGALLPSGLLTVPMVVSGIASCRRQGFEGPVRQTCHLVKVVQHQAPGLGCIQHVIAEAGGELCQLFAGLVEGCLSLALKTHAALLHREQLGIKDSTLGCIKRRAGLVAKLFEGLVQHCALPQAVAEANYLRLLRCMGFTQFLAVADGVEVADHTPAPAKAFPDRLKRWHHRLPLEGLPLVELVLQRLLKGCKVGFERFQQARDLGAHLIGGDGRVVGEAPALEQGRLAAGGHAVSLQPRGRRL